MSNLMLNGSLVSVRLVSELSTLLNVNLNRLTYYLEGE